MSSSRLFTSYVPQVEAEPLLTHQLLEHQNQQLSVHCYEEHKRNSILSIRRFIIAIRRRGNVGSEHEKLRRLSDLCIHF